MSYFKEIEGDCAILVSGGVYKQAPLFTMDGHLFAQTAGGYVRLARDGSTSKPKTRIQKLITDMPLYQDGLGRLTVQDGPRCKPLAAEHTRALLAAPEGA